ncbi:Hsp70 family protein [Herpetosiphon sp. NSE202]|uniref:Hsp70 family protein n=1 Tax=Herpetosiphon sp. NSE202 TaxID=3351349 RepID=UPI00363CE8E4
MRVGLDFGTTNTTAAIYDGAKVTLVPLDSVAANPNVLRTALFITPEGQQLFGRAAINAFTEGNVGREIIYERRYVGTVTNTYSGVGTIVQSVEGMVDSNPPGRLFQSIKTMLRDPSYIKTNVFGQETPLEELIAKILRAIRREIERFTGEKISAITVGRPVHYADTPEGDALAIRRMREACELADLPNVSFMPEPVAAAHAFAASQHERRNIVVFDFGGGTLDVTVMAIDGDERHVLATDGVPIGGDVLDSKIVTGALRQYFGDGARLGPRKLPLPATLLEHLDNWQNILEMHTPKMLEIIEEAVRTSDKPTELKALRTLVRENYGLVLYEHAEEAKRQLSSERQVEISMHVDGIDFDHLLPRFEFERLIGPEARSIGACVDRTIKAAGLSHDQIDVVLRTGGSSRIPRFIKLLADRFTEDRLREQDPFTSVGAGLAVAAYEGRGEAS